MIMPSPFSQKPERRFRGGEACANIKVIIAAHRRGWTDKKIALAAGVSAQAINERLKSYGEIRGKTRRISNVARTYFKCEHCGTRFWVTKEQKSRNTRFCSMVCSSFPRRALTQLEVETAIEYRRQGKLRNALAEHFDLSLQAIQRHIWIYLFERQLLTPRILREIWVFRSTGRHAAWNWLEASTGIIASNDGGRILPDRPYWPGRSPDGVFKRQPAKNSLKETAAPTGFNEMVGADVRHPGDCDGDLHRVCHRRDVPGG